MVAGRFCLNFGHFTLWAYQGFPYHTTTMMNQKKQFLFLVMAVAALFNSAQAQNIQNNPGSNHGNKFEQLGTILPTPTNTVPPAVRRDLSTGSSVAITILNVSSMK